MDKILYIGSQVEKPLSGADQVNFRNQRLLEYLFPKCVDYVASMRTSIIDKLMLGVNREVITQVRAALRTNDYSYVFVSQSLMGRIVRMVKKEFPYIRIVLFFHNIEVQYAQEYFKTKGLRAIPFYIVVRYWEKVGCHFADDLITLNSRDSNLLKQYYGRIATIELPTTFMDNFDFHKAQLLCQRRFNISDTPIDYLFVGVSFFANVHGVQWFIDNVMPYVKGHFHIVGKGMDSVHFNHLSENIHIHGYVEDLSAYYYLARVVVMPIFVGGGMKTKTAEALMYGKTILGTSEAFEGYRVDSSCMILCNTADEYCQALNSIDENFPLINEKARELFRREYSDEVAINKLKIFFCTKDNNFEAEN